MSPRQVQHDVNTNDINDDEDAYMEDAFMQHSPASFNHGGSSAHVPPLPPKPLRNILEQVSYKEKDKLAAAAQNMDLKPDLHPANTTVKKKQSSSQSKMLEVTKSQGKQIFENIRKLYAVED
jgi:hypothetical protein